MSLRSKLVAGSMSLALAIGGLTLSTETAQTAEAACRVTDLKVYSVRNVNCRTARHFLALTTGTMRYAPWVSSGRVSRQKQRFHYSLINFIGSEHR